MRNSDMTGSGTSRIAIEARYILAAFVEVPHEDSNSDAGAGVGGRHRGAKPAAGSGAAGRFAPRNAAAARAGSRGAGRTAVRSEVGNEPAQSGDSDSRRPHRRG